MAEVVERFAPSPTGPLHLGHAYSALMAFDAARKADGRFLLRIEDTDITRARPEWEAAIHEDLRWLGISWEDPVLRQSERFEIYRDQLRRLWDMGLLYPCSCSRRDVLAAASAPQEGAPLIGPDGIVYPGTCRGAKREGPMPEAQVYRLDMERALAASGPLEHREIGQGRDETVRFDPGWMANSVGDVVLGRHGTGTSYHLAVVVDDAAQGVTHVTRGEDLAEATGIHILLQRLMGFHSPVYRHHALIRDENGKRLAKRHDARAIRRYRDEGCTPEDIREMIGLA